MKKFRLKFMLMIGIYCLSLLIAGLIDYKYNTTQCRMLVMIIFVSFLTSRWYDCEKELQHKNVNAEIFERKVNDFRDEMDELFEKFDKPELNEGEIYGFYNMRSEIWHWKYLCLKYVRDGYSFEFGLNSGLNDKRISTVDVEKDNSPNGIYYYFDEESGYILVKNI